MHELLTKLQGLGLTEYQAKAYLALLEHHPVTGYELAKRSGIPRSKIYEVLDRLQTDQLVMSLQKEGQAVFEPVPPKQALARLKEHYLALIRGLDDDLSHFDAQIAVEPVWNLRGYFDIMKKAQELLGRAEKTLLCSLWDVEIDFLADDLKEAIQRGVGVAMVTYGKPAQRIGTQYPHGLESALYEEKHGRAFTLVVDDRELLTGAAHGGARATASWTTQPVMVDAAQDYVRHDIYILKVYNRLEPRLFELFGKDCELLRDVLHDNDYESLKKAASEPAAG
ncbi:MAG: TrmB family transcriptional regulator [Planctomycetota bacterium]